MCGRYTLHKKAEEIRARYGVKNFSEDIHNNYNVAPGQLMPVVTETEEDGRSIDLMRWGLIPVWAKDPNIGYKLINARDDTIFDKPMWRNVVLRKRCLIPADGFYEWKKPPAGVKEPKQPFYIRPKQTDLFSFAGVWETWKDVEGLQWKTYSIITTDPNKEMAGIHNRMPVILHEEDEASWLDPRHNNDRDAIEHLLRPFDDSGLEAFEVSRDVNVARNNDEKLIYPINSK